jgi:hypothetical protein
MNNFKLALSLINLYSSTIVEHILEYCKPDPAVAVVYFYFDFNDAQKQRHENLLRSLVLQLSMQSPQIPEALNTLFNSSQDGQQQPTFSGLRSTLQQILGDFSQTCIILDALDETSDRNELLKMIQDIVEWKLEELHILVTSRRESDIEEALETLVTS